ncbi:tautomerase family protein [Mesorhizobium sp. CAU 1732]|uniref:tautomerase family protein n=1 Tax=Mesorhizobium sp. CAU 1732 TaxID=3140358 RepID=UPI003261CBB2
MPTYICWTAAGLLSSEKRAQIAEAITTIHAEEGRAPLYFVQVLFNDVQPASHFVGGQPAADGHIWIRADIRSGRTDEQKKAILERIATEVSTVAKVGREDVWVYISDISAAGVLEFGHVLPQPGEEDAWFAKLPKALRERLKALS